MRWQYIRDTLKEKRYLYIFLFFFFGYITFYYGMMSYFNGSFTSFLKAYTISYIVPALTLNTLTATLLGITAALSYKRFTLIKNLGGGSFFSAIGLLGTALATGCPGCIVGFFPFVLSIFGITASLSTLPFNGLEITAASAALLGISIYTLAKQPTCKVVQSSQQQ